MAKKKPKERKMKVSEFFEKYARCRSANGRTRAWNRFIGNNPTRGQLKAIIKRLPEHHFLAIMARMSIDVKNGKHLCLQLV